MFSGTECLISAHVPTLKGGASNEIGVHKGLRLQTIARENRLPHISLIQTVGYIIVNFSCQLT
jgi:acetyl-CoA carboxylase carboxyltransferase component